MFDLEEIKEIKIDNNYSSSFSACYVCTTC